MKTRSLLVLALLCFAAAAVAQTPPPGEGPPAPVAVPDDPSSLLSLTLDMAWSRFGSPRRLLSVRGDEPWQDDVAFEYAGGVSFFWYREHLWQIRLAGEYAGSCFGVFLGDSPEKALSLWGQPDSLKDAYLEWRLPYQGYPVRLRALTRDGVISEIYVYRSDF